MASVEFNYDISLFRSAITKTDRALSLLQGRNKIISELLGISESYDGEEDVNSACASIREVLMTVGFLLTDMSASERQMEGIESSNIFGMTLSSDILNGMTLDQLLEQLGAESEDDLLDFFVTNYEFTDEELNNINSCLEEGKYNTVLQLITGINRYKYYEELLQAASGDKDQEATINGMLIDEEKRIKFIADYYSYYEALAQGELKNDNSSITDFDKFRNSAKYGSDAKSIMIAYGDYLKSNPDAQISGFDLLDYIGENDPQAKNMSGIDLETYLSGAYLNAADAYWGSNINLPNKIGKILEYYPYMSEEDKAIYKYKREIEGESEANKFFDALKVVSLEQKEGEAYGYDQLKGLLETNSDVVQFFDQTFDSFIRGGRGNLEDIANLFSHSTDLTSNDYETMYILKTIQNINNAGTYIDTTKLDEFKRDGLIDEDKYNEIRENMKLGAQYTVLDILEETGDVTKEQADLARALKENGAHEKALEIGEQLGYGIGYIAPSIAASVLVGGPLGQLVGNSVMFAGTAGGKVGEQLRSGATLGQAYGIALASAAFEVGSGYLIGRIPGLSKVTDVFQVGANDTNAKAIAKIVLRTLTDPLLEGIQEVSEDKVYSLITDVGRGREIDFDDILSLGPEEFKTFYMGALTSAVMNAPNNVITTATLPFKIKGLESNLTLSQILMAYNEGGISREQFEEMATDNQVRSGLISKFESIIDDILSGKTGPIAPNLSEDIIAKYKIENRPFTAESMADLYMEMQNDGIDISERELYKLMFDKNIKAKYETTHTTSTNLANLKNEILKKINPNLGPIALARQLYIELNQRLHYDYQFLKNSDYKATPTEYESAMNKYYTKLSFENLDSDSVICKGWAELYRSLLIEAGFDQDKVKIAGGTGRFFHKWIEIEIADDTILIADATETINFTDDLANSKMGAPLNGFVLTDKANAGARISSNFDILGELKSSSENMWRDIDNDIGYLNNGKYFSETSNKADTLFGGMLAKFQSARSKSLKFVKQTEIPESMDGFEAYKYLNKVKRIFFDSDEQASVKIQKYFKRNNGLSESYVTLEMPVGNDNYYMLYGKNTGKLEFSSKTELDLYLKERGLEKW